VTFESCLDLRLWYASIRRLIVSPFETGAQRLPPSRRWPDPMLRSMLAPLIVLPAVAFTLAATQGTPRGQAREEAYRANNVGVAWLERFTYDRAITEFERALSLDGSLAYARHNLALALMYAGQLDRAAAEADRAAAALSSLSSLPQPSYVQGLVAKQRNRPAEALAHFERVLAGDPGDVATRIQLGQIHLQGGRFDRAIPLLRGAIADEPFNATALYTLGLALTRSGERAEGQRLLAEFQSLREQGHATTFGQAYLEQGPYAEALVPTGLEPELVETRVPGLTYDDVTTRLLSSPPPAVTPPPTLPFGRTIDRWTPAARQSLLNDLGAAPTLLDYDADGDLDLLVVGPAAERLYRNDGGRLTDVTSQVGLDRPPPGSTAIGAAGGDYDNDGRLDLFVLRVGTSSLYRQSDAGVFQAVSREAGIPPTPHLALSAAWVDLDHDGDLDLVVAGFADVGEPVAARSSAAVTFPDDFKAAPHLVLRNDGTGRFADITAQAGFASVPARIVAIVPTDADNRRDIDLLLVPYGSTPVLMGNRRDGTFADVSAAAGLTTSGRYTSATTGDFNRDGYTDVLLGRGDAVPVLALSDGRGRFRMRQTPLGRAPLVQAFDYDFDGLLDVLAADAAGVRLWRGIGLERWSDVTATALAALTTSPPARPAVTRAVAVGDLGAGRLDIVWPASGGRPVVWRTGQAPPHAALAVTLAGRVSNRTAAGAKLEMRAGSLKGRLELAASTPALTPATLVFGLGPRREVDVVRVLWPSGIVQAELPERAAVAGPGGRAPAFVVTELDRKPSSCPFLFTWNGERFEFVTDFLGAGEAGYWLSPGRFNRPDPEEHVRIREEQLRPRADGRFVLRVTNELEETLYLDEVELLVLTHPQGVEVFPNEGMTDPPRPFVLHAVSHPVPVRAAWNDQDRPVGEALAAVDGRSVGDLPLVDIRGYAMRHTLTLELADTIGSRPVVVLTGWADYAFSSDNVAAHQRGLTLEPPALEAEVSPGRWRRVADIGVPVGRPQTIVVDLSDAISAGLAADTRRLRIVAAMAVYWDAVATARLVPSTLVEMTTVPLASASLRWRGFTRDGLSSSRAPYPYDYDNVSVRPPWKSLVGAYTGEGPVYDLVAAADNRYVVSKPGDEIALEFDGARLLPAAPGTTRTFLLRAHGFSREMNIRSEQPYAVSPAPHAALENGSGRQLPAVRPDASTHGARRHRLVTRELRSLELEALLLAEERDGRP
jgi:tetratricopeptide (TPR) repeat protein